MDHHPGVRKLKNLNFCCCCGFLNCLGVFGGICPTQNTLKQKDFGRALSVHYKTKSMFCVVCVVVQGNHVNLNKKRKHLTPNRCVVSAEHAIKTLMKDERKQDTEHQQNKRRR